MENRIEFILPVCPLSLQTSGKRLMIRKGKPLFFKTKKATDYQSVIQLFSNAYKPAQPWEGPLMMQITFMLRRPERLNKKGINTGRLFCDRRPDLDNLIKGTQDALKGFWIDDSQICGLIAKKNYCAKGEEPCIMVAIDKITQNTNINE